MKRVQHLWGTNPLKFGRAKASKIQCDFEQLLSLTATISGMDRDIDKRPTVLSSRVHQELNRKIGELWSTNIKVIGAHVDPP